MPTKAAVEYVSVNAQQTWIENLAFGSEARGSDVALLFGGCNRLWV